MNKSKKQTIGIGGCMEARQLVGKYGEKLIGREILTEPIGSWIGGIAKVVRINSLRGLSSKVMYVNRGGDIEDMEIYGCEPVTLIRKKKDV